MQGTLTYWQFQRETLIPSLNKKAKLRWVARNDLLILRHDDSNIIH